MTSSGKVFGKASKRRVLVIDDDYDPERLVYRFAEDELQIAIVGARGPNDAIEYLRGEAATVALIVLDIMLPCEDVISVQAAAGNMRTGFELYKLIHSVYPDIPFVLISRRRDELVRREAAEMKLELNDSSDLDLDGFVEMVQRGLDIAQTR